MNFQKFLVPAALIAVLVLAHRFYSWAGVAVVVSAGMMWLLLHFTRIMQVLKRAVDRPIGFIGSAVMLNAKLKPGMTLLHVVAMTRSLGALQTEKDKQPEVFRWTDEGLSHVTCTFVGGKLTQHELFRPAQPDSPAPADAAPPAP